MEKPPINSQEQQHSIWIESTKLDIDQETIDRLFFRAVAEGKMSSNIGGILGPAVLAHEGYPDVVFESANLYTSPGREWGITADDIVDIDMAQKRVVVRLYVHVSGETRYRVFRVILKPSSAVLERARVILEEARDKEGDEFIDHHAVFEAFARTHVNKLMTPDDIRELDDETRRALQILVNSDFKDNDSETLAFEIADGRHEWTVKVYELEGKDMTIVDIVGIAKREFVSKEQEEIQAELEEAGEK